MHATLKYGYALTLETDQGPVSFHVSGISTLLGMPAGAPCKAYDKADQTTTWHSRQSLTVLAKLQIYALGACKGGHRHLCRERLTRACLRTERLHIALKRSIEPIKD